MKKVLAISLALLLLTSNMGFAVATHYCGGLAVESKLMLSHDELDCDMADMDQKPCKSEPSHIPELSKEDCCENVYQSLDIEDDFKPFIVNSNINPDFVLAFAYTFIGRKAFSTDFTPQFGDYSPPLIAQDIAVLYQVFRI